MGIRKSRHYSAVVALGAFSSLGACQHAGVAPAAPISAATPPVGQPAIAATPTPPSASSASAASSTPASHDPSPFVDVVRLGYSARLASAGKSAFLTTNKLVLGIQGDHVAVEPALLEGLHPGVAEYPRLFGSMPDAAWAVELSAAERTTHSRLSRWTGSEWQNADALVHGRNVIGISAWSGGRTLALVSDDYANVLDFVQLGGPHGAPLPRLDRTAKNDVGCVHGLEPSVMSALASGEVFLAGTRCSLGSDDILTTHGVAVERWGVGQTRGKLDVLPLLGEREAAAAELTSIAAQSADDVFVAGARTPAASAGQQPKSAAYLAHFDGSAWHALPAPPIERIDELQRAPDGKLWALSNGDLWTSNPAAETATWQRALMPRIAGGAGEHAVTSFWVQDSGSVWATLGTDDSSYLVRTKRGAEPLSAPSDAQVAELSKSLDPGGAYDCETPTLVLLTLGRSAPKDADMPSVRAALRGHTELAGKTQFVELPFLTRRYLAARGELEILQQTAEILRHASLPGVRPELRCLSGEPTRTLTVDFGAVKGSPKAALPKPTASAPRAAGDREQLVSPIDFQF